MHQPLGALEQVGCFGVFSGVKGVPAGLGSGARAGFLLLGLRPGGGHAKQGNGTGHGSNR